MNVERLIELRKERAVSQQQLAKVLCIDRTSVGKYEKHGVIPSKDILFRMADYFNVSIDYLLGKTDNPVPANGTGQIFLNRNEKSLISLYKSANEQAQKSAMSVLEFGQTKKATQTCDLTTNLSNVESISVPVVGRAAAGDPIEMIEDPDDALMLDDPKVKPGDFAVIAAGDSMIEEGIKDGDRVIIRPCPEVEDGEIALVAVEDGSTIKRFYKTPTGYKLIPANSAYQPQLYGPDADIRVLGRFIKVIGDRKADV